MNWRSLERWGRKSSLNDVEMIQIQYTGADVNSQYPHGMISNRWYLVEASPCGVVKVQPLLHDGSGKLLVILEWFTLLLLDTHCQRASSFHLPYQMAQCDEDHWYRVGVCPSRELLAYGARPPAACILKKKVRVHIND